MYLAVTSAWCRMFSQVERRKHPLAAYVFGHMFVRSVAAAHLDALLVASVCARLACRYAWQRDGGEPLPLEQPPQGALDPTAAWWLQLEDRSRLGLHYVELGGGTLEFAAISRMSRR